MTTIDFHGVRLDAHAQCLIEGTYEPEEMALADLLFAPGDRVVVAGAGMGWLAVWIARIVGADNVLAVEALPQLAALLRQNVSVDGTPIRVRWGAVSPGGAPLNFTADRDWWLSRPDADGGLAVPGVDLADLQKQGWDCVATDIEGAEVDVLTPDVLAGYRKVLVELHDFRRPGETDLVVQRLWEADLIRVGAYDRRPVEDMRYQGWTRP